MENLNFEGPMTYEEHKLHLESIQNEQPTKDKYVTDGSQDELLEDRLFGEKVNWNNFIQ